jgi:phosphoribosylaminoimidazole carboxylase/phosphoribosylaminoimidazole-succinocarboxamide synthase
MKMTEITTGKVVAEGKTKCLMEIVDPVLPGKVLVVSHDDITAGDGAKHDKIEGKGVLSTMTTCNVFRLLKACGVPVAFDEQVGDCQFIADQCTMLSYEVVVRREAHGSFLHRYPHLPQGHYFPKLVFELFAKTSGKKWNGRGIPMDDPLVKFNGGAVEFYLPHWTTEQKEESKQNGHKGYLVGQKPFLVVSKGEFFGGGQKILKGEIHLQEIEKWTKFIFLVLEKAWQLQNRRLVDFKLEFGITVDGRLVLADVVDNDSWRLVNEAGEYDDKQVYRDGGDLNDVTRRYRLIAELSSRFGLPKQQIIGWVGSDKDDTLWLHNALVECGCSDYVTKSVVVRSAHKEPVKANILLHQAIQLVPDSVVVSYIGMSNGAGPTLSANCTIPNITVSASVEKFPDDVWSSLRDPSSVPVMTVLKPENAMLAALQILAMRNPLIYAKLREKQEERFVNVKAIEI